VLFGLVHSFIAGMARGMMPVMHPRLVPAHAGGPQEGVPEPGPFGTNLSRMAPMAILLIPII